MRKHLLSILFFGALVALFLSGSYFRVFEKNELDTLDMRFYLRGAVPVTDQVAIIEIGDDTIEKLGRFPFDRRYHALLVKALSQYGARAVLFDIFFAEPDKNDAEFGQAVKQAGNVYFPYVFDVTAVRGQKVPEAQKYAAETLESLQKFSAGSGHINVFADRDGKYRRIPLLIKYKDALYPYLSLRLVSDYLGIPAQDIKLKPGQYVQLGSRIRVPVDENSGMMVNYAGEWGKFYKHYSYVDVLRSYVSSRMKEKPAIDLNVFRDKICLIGSTATGATDLHPTPFASLYPALAMHADLVNSVLSRRFIARAPKGVNLFIVLVLGALICAGVLRYKPVKGFLICAGLLLFHAALSILLFRAFGLWIDMFYPLSAGLAVYLICALVRSITEWKKKFLLDNELQIARQIQESFLPSSLPAMPGLDVAALMRTARHVGGDLYDFYEFAPDRLGVMIGDVSGKGMPASLFMTTVSDSFRYFALPDVHPQETLHRLNVKLTNGPSTRLFVTAFYAIFDMDKKVMSYANGGHPPVLYLPKDSPVQSLDVKDGYPLGLLEGGYSGGQVKFSSGDIFVFFTDGITEARNSRAQMYGQHRFAAIVEKNRHGRAQDLLCAIEEDVRKFEPAHKQSDDITSIVLKVA